MPSPLLITNGQLVTWDDEIIEGGALYLENGLIAEVGSSANLSKKYPDAETFDARGQLIMPGNICAHTHFYGAFARGMAIPGPAPKDFPEILERLWWPLDLALDGEAVRYSALVSLIDAVKHGTTTLIDHHASPNAIAGSLDVIADAVDGAARQFDVVALVLEFGEPAQDLALINLVSAHYMQQHLQIQARVTKPVNR